MSSASIELGASSSSESIAARHGATFSAAHGLPEQMQPIKTDPPPLDAAVPIMHLTIHSATHRGSTTPTAKPNGGG